MNKQKIFIILWLVSTIIFILTSAITYAPSAEKIGHIVCFISLILSFCFGLIAFIIIIKKWNRG